MLLQRLCSNPMNAWFELVSICFCGLTPIPYKISMHTNYFGDFSIREKQYRSSIKAVIGDECHLEFIRHNCEPPNYVSQIR